MRVCGIDACTHFVAIGGYSSFLSEGTKKSHPSRRFRGGVTGLEREWTWNDGFERGYEWIVEGCFVGGGPIFPKNVVENSYVDQ